MKYTISFFLLAFLIPGYLAGQAWKTVNLKKPDPYKSYNEVVLLDSTSVSVAPTGSGTFSVYKAIRIQSPAGALSNRVIVYDYDPLTAFAEFRYAKVYKSDGRVIDLDVNKTQDYTAPARMIYWGARQIMLEAGKLDTGDILEYEIHKKGFTYAL